jgi:hypothetical protein
MAKLSTASVFNILLASSSDGPVRGDPSFARQSETNKIRMMRRRSAGPLISKLRNNELALNKESVSSMISCADGSAKDYFNNQIVKQVIRTYQVLLAL